MLTCRSYLFSEDLLPDKMSKYNNNKDKYYNDFDRKMKNKTHKYETLYKCRRCDDIHLCIDCSTAILNPSSCSGRLYCLRCIEAYNEAAILSISSMNNEQLALIPHIIVSKMRINDADDETEIKENLLCIGDVTNINSNGTKFFDTGIKKYQNVYTIKQQQNMQTLHQNKTFAACMREFCDLSVDFHTKRNNTSIHREKNWENVSYLLSFSFNLCVCCCVNLCVCLVL